MVWNCKKSWVLPWKVWTVTSYDRLDQMSYLYFTQNSVSGSSFLTKVKRVKAVVKYDVNKYNLSLNKIRMKMSWYLSGRFRLYHCTYNFLMSLFIMLFFNLVSTWTNRPASYSLIFIFILMRNKVASPLKICLSPFIGLCDE